MDFKLNKVYGNSLIELFDLIIDNIEGDGEYSLRDLQKILKEKYKQIVKRDKDLFIEEKIKELENTDEYKGYSKTKLKKIAMKLYITDLIIEKK